MFSLVKTTAAATVLTATLAAAGFAGGTGQAGTSSAQSGPISCEIQVTPAGGMLTIAGVVRSDHAVSGGYSFQIAGGGSGGSSNISQGGPFFAGPGADVMLGSIMVNAAGAKYDLTLEVTANGTKLECRERIGGII